MTTRDVIFNFDIKSVLTSAKINDLKYFFVFIFIRFHPILLKQGVNRLHELSRNEINVILMSDFYDVIVK